MIRRTLFKKSKYSSQKTMYQGITFDSKREARRYALLLLAEKAGKIHNLQRQVKFELAPAQYVEVEVKLKTKTKAKRVMVHKEMIYIADFVYYDADFNFIVEDTKGFRTKEYIKKKNLMKRIHGIDIKET